MIKEKKKRRALTVAAVIAILLGLAIQAGLIWWRVQESGERAGLLLENFAAASGERAEERRKGLDTLPDGAAAEARERLEKQAKSKGRVQRAKHLELLTLVNPWHTLPEGYTPKLATAGSNWQFNSEYQVDARCAAALRQMLNDCLLTGSIPEICSAYRTQEYQQMLFDNKIERLIEEGVDPVEAPALAATAVALPGTSEHQLGLAVDILDIAYPYLDEYQMYTEAQRWLMEHSWEYGFILRYPDGTSDITGIIYEPWHYRYVGKQYAKAIHDLDITLEEYLVLRNGR